MILKKGSEISTNCLKDIAFLTDVLISNVKIAIAVFEPETEEHKALILTSDSIESIELKIKLKEGAYHETKKE